MPPKKDNQNETTKAPESPVGTTAPPVGATDGDPTGESAAASQVPTGNDSSDGLDQSNAPVQGGDQSTEATDSADRTDGQDGASTGDTSEAGGQGAETNGVTVTSGDSVPETTDPQPGNGGDLNGSGNVEPAAGPEDGDQGESEQGNDPAAANPNTREPDEQRLDRGLDDAEELKAPEEEPEELPAVETKVLRYADVWPRINELQQAINGSGISLVVDSYKETASVVIPLGAVLPEIFNGVILAQ